MASGVLFYDLPFEGSADTLSFDLEEEALDGVEVGVELEGEVVEGLEIGGMNFLEKFVKKGGFLELGEVIEGCGSSDLFPLVIYPFKQLLCCAIIKHTILLINYIPL